MAKLDFTVNTRICKKCGICYGLCPKDVLGKGSDGSPVVVNAGSCIFCKMCEMRCPDYAIRVRRVEE